MTADTRLPAAALWDFDGTLADTEPLWMVAEHALADELGGTWTDQDARALVGNSLLDSARHVLAVHGRDDLTPEWVVEWLVTHVNAQLAAGEVPWRPGARELLESYAAAGVPCALVSASYRSTLESVVAALPDGTFATSVAGDEVDRGKPDPEPYLVAARRLGVDPADCVVFEDSVPGTTSGNASGAVVVAIRNHVPLPQAPRRVVVDTLAGHTAQSVAALVAGVRA